MCSPYPHFSWCLIAEELLKEGTDVPLDGFTSNKID
jgi:hypothetical protein